MCFSVFIECSFMAPLTHCDDKKRVDFPLDSLNSLCL